MILKYPIYPPDEQGRTYLDFDTESLDLKQRADYGKASLKATAWRVDVRLSSYANVPDSLGVPGTILFTSADIVFSGLPNQASQPGGEYRCDALALLNKPELAIATIAISCNLQIDLDKLKFKDPDDVPEGSPDWQAVDSPVGPPLASLPGYFSQNFKVKQPEIGGKWTGPSGQVYQIVRWKSGGAFAFGWLTVWQTI